MQLQPFQLVGNAVAFARQEARAHAIRDIAKPQVEAHTYIDDAALGCPLEAGVYNARPYVDWHRVRKHLIAMGAL